jgi:hypothetical protein
VILTASFINCIKQSARFALDPSKFKIAVRNGANTKFIVETS